MKLRRFRALSRSLGRDEGRTGQETAAAGWQEETRKGRRSNLSIPDEIRFIQLCTDKIKTDHGGCAKEPFQRLHWPNLESTGDYLPSMYVVVRCGQWRLVAAEWRGGRLADRNLKMKESRSCLIRPQRGSFALSRKETQWLNGPVGRNVCTKTPWFPTNSTGWAPRHGLHGRVLRSHLGVGESCRKSDRRPPEVGVTRSAQRLRCSKVLASSCSLQPGRP